METRRLFLKVSAVAAALFCGAAAAQTFPTKPITLMYTTAPGGSFDPMSRVIANYFEKKWGQPVVIESKAGGGGLVAHAYVARSAPPDGHTLLMGASHF